MRNADDTGAAATGRLWRLALDQPPRAVSPKRPASFRRVSAAEAAELAGAMGAATSEAVTARFQAGRQCHAGWVAGQLAAYCWASFDEEAIGEQGLSIRLRLGEAYLWDCATLPAFRRQGLYSALLAHVIGVLRADGLRSVWIGADLDNIASHGGIARAGFRPVADLYRGGPDGRALWLQGCPGAPAAWVADARWALFGEAAH